jgi:hypothetical protein
LDLGKKKRGNKAEDNWGYWGTSTRPQSDEVLLGGLTELGYNHKITESVKGETN